VQKGSKKPLQDIIYSLTNTQLVVSGVGDSDPPDTISDHELKQLKLSNHVQQAAKNHSVSEEHLARVQEAFQKYNLDSDNVSVT
jgi:hypothetical protein